MHKNCQWADRPHAPIRVPKEQENNDQQKALVECRPKILQRLSQWNNLQELNSVGATDFLCTLGIGRLGAFIAVEG